MKRHLAIKVCGMRLPDNIRSVEALGIDMMGFIFHPASPRYVAEVPAYMPERCTRTGVFVDTDPAVVLRRVDEFGLGAVQLHGSESAAYCRALRDALPADTIIIKALQARSAEAVRVAETYCGSVSLLLFDTPCASGGGSGKTFNWDILDNYTGTTPFMLSGGLAPDSVPAVLSLAHPQLCGIDLNSRFEISPGIKDVAALERFIAEIRDFS